MRKRLWITLLGISLVVIGAAGAAVSSWNALHRPLPIPADGAWLEVPSGTPLRRVSEGLATRGLLPHPALITTYARLTGDATRVRAGEYQLTPGTTPLGLLEKLVAAALFSGQFRRGYFRGRLL